VVPPTTGFPAWHAHPDVWLVMASVGAGYLCALRQERVRRGGGGPPVATRRQLCAFAAGLTIMWVASDWPIHDLGEGYLFSVHMVQHLLYSLVVAPLLILGLPGWLARRLLGTGRLAAVVRGWTRPLPALITVNGVILVTHWPAFVDFVVVHHAAHFGAHVVLFGASLIMWWPVVSPLPEHRISPPYQMLYLFVQTILPTVPASFLTFGSEPLYHVYARLPRLNGISALSDQQIAGIIMKLGGGFFLYAVIGVVFFTWYAGEERREGLRAKHPVAAQPMVR